MMLTKIKLHLLAPKGVRPSAHWGSLLHGALMRSMPPSVSDVLHDGSGMRPYSQYVEPLNASSAIWQIGLFGEGTETVCERLPELKEVFLKGRGTVRIENAVIEQVSKRDFIAETEEGTNGRKCQYTVHFITPCGQKSMGAYLSVPSIRLLLENLYSRVLCHLPDAQSVLPDALEQIVGRIQVVKYQLSSTAYYMERVRIPGFDGTMQLRLDADLELTLIFNLMVRLAEYTGIGIKTALGMGAVRVDLPKSVQSHGIMVHL